VNIVCPNIPLIPYGSRFTLTYDCLTYISTVYLPAAPQSLGIPVFLLLSLATLAPFSVCLCGEFCGTLAPKTRNKWQPNMRFIEFYVLGSLSRRFFALCLSKDNASRLLTWPDIISLQLFWRLAGIWFLFYFVGEIMLGKCKIHFWIFVLAAKWAWNAPKDICFSLI